MATGRWNWFAGGLEQVLRGEVDFGSDSFKLMLLTSEYTPDPSHDFQSDLTGEVVGEGYEAGGLTLAGVNLVRQEASALSTWAPSTEYRLGQVRRKVASNGFVYRCVEPGVSGSAEPAWPTVIGREVTDGTCVWVCAGRNLIKLSASNPTWESVTLTARFAALVDVTPGNPADNVLIGWCDFGEDVSASSGSFSLTFDPDGILQILV